ncbi:hypothetical protein INS49_002089 [Diaporthe citri]|uniref:uncharacterized protein n=1 Tax=Diaporthe citri TaxID=83186 RepID=UPI001C8080EE|nr:uncharacterized protein INS49_002089 [Diaporthe citri]KAG6367890.1 hypothetical protein INS49_002089 [Diaporthe citri]
MSDPRRSMPLTFLPLGPVTSESFPKAQQPKQDGDGHKRRSSSLSSDGKGSAPGYRVLKVAPVHYGEHAGDHQDDWHNAAAVISRRCIPDQVVVVPGGLHSLQKPAVERPDAKPPKH